MVRPLPKSMISNIDIFEAFFEMRELIPRAIVYKSLFSKNTQRSKFEPISHYENTLADVVH